jgi:hypothetical protein
MVRTLPSRPAIGDEPSNAPVCPLPPVAGPCSSRRDISLGLCDTIRSSRSSLESAPVVATPLSVSRKRGVLFDSATIVSTVSLFSRG